MIPKNNETFSPLDYPEVEDFFHDLVYTILSESDRAAIIIGAALIEKHLENFIQEILPEGPKKFHHPKKNNQFKYPNIFSSFSSKIKLLYAFRLIPQLLYEKLWKLKDIRNDAAHLTRNIEFSSSSEKDRLQIVYNLGPAMNKKIRHDAMVFLFNHKKSIIINAMTKKFGLSEKESEQKFWEFIQDSDRVKQLENQIPQWEFAYGLTLLCGLIYFYKEQTKKVLEQYPLIGMVPIAPDEK